MPEPYKWIVDPDLIEMGYLGSDSESSVDGPQPLPKVFGYDQIIPPEGYAETNGNIIGVCIGDDTESSM